MSVTLLEAAAHVEMKTSHQSANTPPKLSVLKENPSNQYHEGDFLIVEKPLTISNRSVCDSERSAPDYSSSYSSSLEPDMSWEHITWQTKSNLLKVIGFLRNKDVQGSFAFLIEQAMALFAQYQFCQNIPLFGLKQFETMFDQITSAYNSL